MKFYSTNNKNHIVTAKEAILTGLAPDKGLFMPVEIPKLSSSFLGDISKRSFNEIALEVSKLFFSDEIDNKDLEVLVNRAFNFTAPIKQIDKDLFVLELFHGPTLAFKDFAAHFMAQIISFYRKEEKGTLDILVATSGDTGGAVANGFHNVPGINVTILYPSGKVSPLQEKQLTTLGGNVRALEIQGTFDDCQALVKEAFLDSQVNSKLELTSANSINIARLIPQSFYYFYAVAQLQQHGIKNDPVFCVPSGNFGNLCAGVLASKMGLKVKTFIAANNSNDPVVRFLDSGNFEPRETKATISNAMDVGNPNNFPRLLELYGKSLEELRNHVLGASFDDAHTRSEIKNIYNKYNYISDPHTAVGFLGIEKYKQFTHGAANVVLATAHPVKFTETMEEVLPGKVKIPEQLAGLMTKQKNATLLPASYLRFKDYLLSQQKL